MARFGGAQQVVFPDKYLCECADKFIACESKRYIEYWKYKIGKDADIDLALKVSRLKRIICEGSCGLCEDEIIKLKEIMNKIIS